MWRGDRDPPGIARELILRLTGAMVLLWLLAAVLATLAIRHELGEAFDSALQETAQRLLPLAVDDVYEHEQGAAGQALSAAAVTGHDEYLTYQLRDGTGGVLLRSHDAPAAGYAAPLRTGFADAGGWRIYTEGSLSGSLFLQVAEPLAHRREALMESALSLLLPLAALVPLTGLAIWWAVRRALHPLLRLRHAIEARDGGHLAPVGTDGLPVEIRPIAAAVDRLLLRLRTALDAERGFAANSAHELRTPIAAALAQSQRLQAEAADPQLQARAGRIAADLRRLAGMAEKLLQLSRADAGIARPAAAQDLLPVIGHVLQDMAGAGEAVSAIAVDAGRHRSLSCHIDIDAFAIVLRNLLENALRHGPAGGPVRLAVDGCGAIHVVSGGPRLPAELLAGLTARFARGTGSAPGSGLGLAIADRILEQAGGRLELRSPATGQAGGFEAIVRLPD